MRERIRCGMCGRREIGAGVSCRTWVLLDACRMEEAEDTDDAIPRPITSFSQTVTLKASFGCSVF